MKILVLLLFAFISATMFAQSSIGIRGGVFLAQYNYKINGNYLGCCEPI
jgi:hypothetical protein